MMKNYVLTALGMLIGTALIAQNSDTTEVSVKIISRKNKDSIIVDAGGQTWVKTNKRKNVTTSFFSGIDLGFANFIDRTNYSSAAAQDYAPGSTAEWFDLRNGKSVNINLWLFSQKVNLVQHVVNLKYAVGVELNNYRYKNPIRYRENTPYVYWDNTTNRPYSKNKLAADYVTVPLMLNFDFGRKGYSGIKYRSNKNKSGISLTAEKEREFGFSVGISTGYLYASRNKTITSDEGKQKTKDNFDLRTWKIAYVAEINLGYISIFGTYATKSMYKNGLDMTPYSIGLRL